MDRRTARAWRSTSWGCRTRGCWRCTHHYDPGAVYDALFATIDRPTIVIENKLLYGLRVSDSVPDGFVLEHSDELFPTTRIRPEAEPDVTILCYGGMLPEVEKALDPLFDEHEIACEVICPTSFIRSTSGRSSNRSSRTGRLLVVEEGMAFAAFGAEVVAQIVERAPGSLRRLRRLASPEHPIPVVRPARESAAAGARITSSRPSGSCANMISKPTPILAPRENVNDESATIVAWIVADGDRVEPGQSLAQIETSKAVLEIEATIAGLLHHAAREGEEISIGGLIGHIEPSEIEPANGTAASNGWPASPVAAVPAPGTDGSGQRMDQTVPGESGAFPD